jgi:hypothetical protein
MLSIQIQLLEIENNNIKKIDTPTPLSLLVPLHNLAEKD